ncbi:hypothetical protein OROGR_015207 [Orobanche gracilis]
MSSIRLVLFVVNDNDDFGGGDGGNHWSILVYDRTKNLFLHFDSMEGVNNFYAMKLYDAVKEYIVFTKETEEQEEKCAVCNWRRKSYCTC